jgi:hypothetical protein
MIIIKNISSKTKGINVEIDKGFLIDCLCSSIFSAISMIAIIFTLITESYGDLVLFWLSLTIWSILFIISMTFFILTIIQHLR